MTSFLICLSNWIKFPWRSETTFCLSVNSLFYKKDSCLRFFENSKLLLGVLYILRKRHCINQSHLNSLIMVNLVKHLTDTCYLTEWMSECLKIAFYGIPVWRPQSKFSCNWHTVFFSSEVARTEKSDGNFLWNFSGLWWAYFFTCLCSPYHIPPLPCDCQSTIFLLNCICWIHSSWFK